MAKLSCRPSVTSKGSPAILHLLASLRHLFIIISLILLSGILLSGDKAELKPKNYPLGIINPNKGIEDMPKAFVENQQKVDTVFMVHPIFIIKRLIRHD